MNNFLWKLLHNTFWRNNIKIRSEQLFSLGNENKSLGDMKHILANRGHLWVFFKSMGRIFWLKTRSIHVLFMKITRVFYIFGKNARNKCFKSKCLQFSGNFSQIFVFPHPDIGLMTKDLDRIKVYTYFNIGDAKTLVKLKEK